MLANAGYDVWFGNNRGNEFSEGHVNLTTSDEKFWDFDQEEMGLYDVPAEVEYILNNTGKDKINAYIGHSEGTTQFFMGASMLPDYYASKFQLYAALAPIARLTYEKDGVLRFAS
jgi:lysosomal acid lipase/cholesteryl ester hydrolase